jgi:hypothetical protein
VTALNRVLHDCRAAVIRAVTRQLQLALEVLLGYLDRLRGKQGLPDLFLPHRIDVSTDFETGAGHSTED